MRGKIIQAILMLAVIGVMIFVIAKIPDVTKGLTGGDQAENVMMTEPETETETESQESQSQEETETSGEEPVSVAAEVAGMDDGEDPGLSENEKKNENPGASVDMEDIMSAESETALGGKSFGIDVAKWQGNIDWKKVKDSGVEFAMIRVGYRTQKTGVILEDPAAKYNLQQAQAAGIKLGAYFFSTAVNEKEAREEAAWVADFISRYRITYPVAYNCEGFQSEDSRQHGMSNKERTDCAIAFLDYVKGAGYTPMFYAAKNEMSGNAWWDIDRIESRYKVWVSQYPSVPYPQTPNSSYEGAHAMWQYTSQGTVPGISKPVDINIAYFSYSKEADPKNPELPEPVPADPELGITFTEVNETVTAKIETNLRTAPSTGDGSSIVVKLKNGETAGRTGIGNNGWSRLNYNGQTLYAVSSYLTTDLNYHVEIPVPTTPAVPETTIPETETGGGQQETQENQESQGSQSGTQPSSQVEYQEVSEMVTAKSLTNLRSQPGSGSQDTVVAVLKFGDVATRTGIGNNGWSRLVYNGQTLYAVSSYLTTDMNYQSNQAQISGAAKSGAPAPQETEAGPGAEETTRAANSAVYTAVNEQVTAKIETNLRSEPSTASNDSVVGKIRHGDVVTRTGIGSNGWSRIDYNGQTVYAVSSYLEKTE